MANTLYIYRQGLYRLNDDPVNPPKTMSDEWEMWETLLNMGRPGGYDPRQLAIEQAVESFLSGMVEDPAYQADAVVEGTLTPLIASRESAIECSIKAAPGTDLHIGDMVECLQENWLVVELYTDKIGILNGKMWVCNDTIRFQNHSPYVNTRFCVVDDGSYSKRSADPIAYVPVNTYKIYLSIDSATQKLFIDKRLAFGKIFASDGSEVLEVYKIIGIDLKSKNFGEGSHLMVLTVQRDVYHEKADSIDDNLCDVFVEESGDSATPAATGSCVIVGRDEVRIGTSRKYSVVFTDIDGAVVEGIVPTWNIISPDGSTETIIDETVTLAIPLEEKLIGDEITLTATDPDGLYGAFEKKVQVVAIG